VVFSFQANDVASGVIDFVTNNNISHVVIGATNEKTGLINKIFKKSIVNKLIDNLPHVSFHVISTSSARI
jgi:K+-sensing histidine kinase KdpD